MLTKSDGAVRHQGEAATDEEFKRCVFKDILPRVEFHIRDYLQRYIPADRVRELFDLLGDYFAGEIIKPGRNRMSSTKGATQLNLELPGRSVPECVPDKNGEETNKTETEKDDKTITV